MNMNCLDPKCIEVTEDTEWVQGVLIRTCKNGHRTGLDLSLKDPIKEPYGDIIQ